MKHLFRPILFAAAVMSVPAMSLPAAAQTPPTQGWPGPPPDAACPFVAGPQDPAATSRSPAPSAQTISVFAGARLTIRPGAASRVSACAWAAAAG